MSYKEKVIAWIKKEKEENGLLYVKPIVHPLTLLDPENNPPPSEDEVYEDMWYIIQNWESFETVVSTTPQDKKLKPSQIPMRDLINRTDKSTYETT